MWPTGVDIVLSHHVIVTKRQNLPRVRQIDPSSIPQLVSFLVVLMAPPPNSAESTPMPCHLKVAHGIEAGAILET